MIPLPLVVVQEGSPLEVDAAGAGPRCDNERRIIDQAPFRACLRPIVATAFEHCGQGLRPVDQMRQTQCGGALVAGLTGHLGQRLLHAAHLFAMACRHKITVQYTQVIRRCVVQAGQEMGGLRDADGSFGQVLPHARVVQQGSERPCINFTRLSATGATVPRRHGECWHFGCHGRPAAPPGRDLL